MSFSCLPLIDLKSCPDDIRQSLLSACTITGFFYVTNHGLDSLLDKMFLLSKEFFQLPLDDKRRYLPDTTSFQGYFGIGHENLDSADPKFVDQKESFKIQQLSLYRKEELPNILRNEENFNLFKHFFRQCYNLCMTLFEYLAEVFDIDRNYFTSLHTWDEKPSATVKCLHYPPIDQEKINEKTIRAGAHSDYGTLTLIFQRENQSGLEILDRSTNQWYPVEARDDMIVVNFGDVLEYCSKGMIKSTIHRVVPPASDKANQSRFSIAYFCDPDSNAPLVAIPSKLIENRVYIKDEHATHVFNYSPDIDGRVITAGEHLLMKLRGAYYN